MSFQPAQSRYVLPSFVERTSYGVKESNPYNKLFEERIIFLGVQIDDASANDVMAQLLVLESIGPGPRHPDVHQLAGWLVHLVDGDLRHDAVRAAGDQHGLPGAGRVGRGGAARRGHAGQAAGRAERADPASTSRPPRASTARCRTWRSRPRRSPGCASCWRRRWPSTAARRPEQVRQDIERDKILTAPRRPRSTGSSTRSSRAASSRPSAERSAQVVHAFRCTYRSSPEPTRGEAELVQHVRSCRVARDILPVGTCRRCPPCGCRELGHVMRPARTRAEGRRAGLVAGAGRSRRRPGECGLRVGADRAIGAGGGCCSARCTPAALRRGGVVR